MLSAKQGNYWYHFYNVVLDWGLDPGPPALEASTLPLGYRGYRTITVKLMHKQTLYHKYDSFAKLLQEQ